MQILAITVIFLAILAFLIFKIRDRFKIKELVILLAIIFSFSLVTYFYLENKENKIPNLFKAKYEEELKIKIKKFSSTRVNNIYLSSDKIFVYDFNYIIEKNGIEEFCSLKNQKIIKIEDEYVFENFKELKEECKKK